MPFQLKGAAAALLLASGASAFATASSSIKLTDLTITVSAISNKAGAATPYVTFGSSSDYLRTGEQSSSYQIGILNPAGFFSPASMATVPDLAGGSASIAGDPFSASGGAMTATAFASGVNGGMSTAEGYAVVGDDAAWTSFTVGANTLLQVSAHYDIAAFDHGEMYTGAYEVASYVAELTLFGTNGRSQQNSFDSVAGSVAHVGYYFDTPFAQEGDLEVSFVGSKTSAFSGFFSATVIANALSDVSPVPESGSAMLLLAGVALLATRHRKTRA